jgi:photosystem II stability/assembly factor-like uncharacterized protein
MLKKFLLLFLSLLISFTTLIAQDNDNEEKEDKSPYKSSTFNGLNFRLLGPAITSGRVTDFAVNPNNYHEFFAAVASGNVWKTTNSGTTWEPVFDNYGSYSIGCVTLDPNNPHVVYVGTGENNSQRSVSWGDGIYRSEDGGKSFKNIGLKKSEHIAKILVDPRDSKVIYVAAQGPLWGPGGHRGLYKTTDYGVTWDSVLYISENTGVTDVVMDPRDPDVLYAASYQRRRHVWVLLNGGPEGAIYKSTDAGATWNKLKSGLPSGDIGRIGLAISPVNPDHVFAIIEAQGDEGGFFKSTNRGASWEKTNDYKTVSAQYYNEIFCDPKDVNKIYSLDTRTKISIDGGTTFNNLGNDARHVDDHALWINPENTDHFLIGGDGGIYETFDGAITWLFKSNLPITQFYRVSVDNAEPFYWVYGGTQDNNSMGVPSQTINNEGIVNADWLPTLGGDGYETQVDPVDPNIVYAQYQYGGLVRYDKKSGEQISIKPQEGKDDEVLKWNWDSPLLLSPHKHTRLYFAANKLFKSDDRGNSWVAISGDLTRQIDRNKLEVMGKVWSVDAVAKNASTSFYGNIVSLTESPLMEGLIYIGTDDGLIQVTEDDGKNWKKIEKFPGVPEMTYVSSLYASMHDPNTVYAAFDNHKRADFKPYVLKSSDKGNSWQSISGDLKDPFIVYSIIQDHINPELLFAGTEYGVYFSINEGKKWFQLKGGLPTIAVRDVDIQRRENDLVLGTFGRGFYVLDNYSALRGISEKNLDEENILFPVKDALMFMKRRGTFGGVGKSFFKAENPPFGATFTYYIKEAPKTLKKQRQEIEKELIKENKPVSYPSWNQLRLEDREEKAFLLFIVSDDKGNVVRKLKEGVKSGINRITWDLRFANTNPVRKVTDKNESGTPVMPGKYSVEMFMSVDGELTKIAGPQSFEAKVLLNSSLPAEDREELVVFQKTFWEFNRAVEGALSAIRDLKEKTAILIYAIKQTPNAPNSLMEDALKIKRETDDILQQLFRDETIANRNEPTKLTIYDRLNEIAWGMWKTTSSPTQTQRDSYKAASEEFETLLTKVKQLIEVDLKNLEVEMEKYGAPWTPGRVPDWKK